MVERKHRATQPGYIDNGTSAYTCEECWVEVRFIHLDRHDAWHRRLVLTVMIQQAEQEAKDGTWGSADDLRRGGDDG
jgi:hypothetical protein